MKQPEVVLVSRVTPMAWAISCAFNSGLHPYIADLKGWNMRPSWLPR